MSSDAFVIVVSTTAIALFTGLTRALLTSYSASYRALSPVVRHESLRRLLNGLILTPLAFVHAAILYNPSLHAHDILYGYTSFAHIIYLVTIAFYLFDLIVLVSAPISPWLYTQWLVHHVFTILLMSWASFFRRSSAAPIAVFLVAGVVHLLADVKNFARALNYRNPTLHTFLRMAMVLFSILAGVLPPPHLLRRAARHRGVSTYTFAISHMRPICWAVFLLFYIPHLLVPLYNLRVLRRRDWFVDPGPLDYNKNK